MTAKLNTYVGRFAPSPTGPLHAGSLVTALASWLDARAHGGRWLLRIEDVDGPRCIPGADEVIMSQLAACGLRPDAAPEYQSRRGSHYQHALDSLVGRHLAYPCGCTRQDIADALAASGQYPQRFGELVYPGTCRYGLNGRLPRAWRFNTTVHESNRPLAQVIPAQTAINSIADDSCQDAAVITWQDRRLGQQQQNVNREVGDFVLRRADSLWAYQLAVVVDDADQRITHVVRGEDLSSNTARQILLQSALGLPTPHYLHVPLVLGADGQKLSKQNGAMALDLSTPAAVLDALRVASRTLGLDTHSCQAHDWQLAAVSQWRGLYPSAKSAPAP